MNPFAFTAGQYAGRGWCVFPCVAGAKVPATTHGLHDATTDRDVIRQWWERWPRANVAIRTGAVSGLVVLDVDGPEGFASLKALEARHGALPRTYTVSTPRGGLHFYFAHPGGTIPNSAGKIAPGIDLRGDGGYVVAPPSVLTGRGSYTGGGSEVPPCPLTSVLRPPPPPMPTRRPRPLTVLPGGKYGYAALEGEVAKVRSAPVGTRNHTLNAASFALGQLIAAGALDAEPAVGALLHAAQSVGLGQRESERTIVSGLRAGGQTPRSLRAS